MTNPSSRLPNLGTETEKFISNIEKNSENKPPLYKLTPQEAREVLNSLQKADHKKIEADSVDRNIFTEMAGNVDVRIVRPKDSKEKLPIILYIHGGGWVLGGKDAWDMLIRKLAVKTKSVVVFPNYSLSPEAKYPIAINQIYGILNYIYENPDEFNADSDRIAIAGDSAGGNMAAVTTLMAKNQGGPKIKFQCLFYPVTNADMDTQSYNEFKDGPWLTKKAMEWFFDAYLESKKLRDDPYVSPLKATEEDLAGLPPALIITDENDVLRDEGEAYARKLDAAGVNVVNVRMNGTFHDFVVLNGLSETPQTKAALALASKLIKHHLA